MKNYYLLFVLMGILACSSDDDNPVPDPIESATNYFPLVEENEWIYDNVSTNEEGSDNTSEVLNVDEEVQSEGFTKYALSSSSGIEDLSITRILSSGLVYKNNGKLLLSGNLDLDLGEDGELPDFGFAFDDLVIYDENAVSGSVLFTTEQNTTLPEFENVTLSISVKIESKSLGTQASIDVNGVTYEDILSSSVVVSLAVNASVVVPPFPLPINIAIIDNQEVVVSVNHFANQVGLVKSNTTLSLSFNDLGGAFPLELEDILSEVVQELSSYNVQLDE